MPTGSSSDHLSSGRMASRKIRALHDIDNEPNSKRAKMLNIINTKDTSRSALADIVEGLTGSKPSQDELHVLGQARFETVAEKIELRTKSGGHCDVGGGQPESIVGACRLRVIDLADLALARVERPSEF